MPLDIPPASDTEPFAAFRNARTELERAAQLSVAGELVAAITHDLRQPLTALEMNISAAIQFLRRTDAKTTEALDALHDALSQQDRMRELLRVLESLAVRREPRCAITDIVSIVREVMVLVGSDVLARHVPLEFEVAHPVPPVFGDATMIRQALLNMALDALEATSLSSQRHSPVHFTVRETDGLVEVSVTHFGVRIEAQGLDDWGLALARSVVEAHGGTIVLEGSAEAGVRLTTRWPTGPRPTDGGASHAR